MDDLISRQDAIDELRSELDGVADSWQEMRDLVIDILKGIPPVLDPERIWLDLICEIQHQSLARGTCHYGNAGNWCIFGHYLKDAIYNLYGGKHEN